MWQFLDQQPQRIKLDQPMFEKSWKRKDLHAWDAKWASLSTSTRKAFLNLVQANLQPERSEPLEISESEARILQTGGFVTLRGTKIQMPEPARPFGSRLVVIAGSSLLTMQLDANMFAGSAYHLPPFVFACQQIFQEAKGLARPLNTPFPLEPMICSPQWAGWVAAALKNPIAVELVKAIRGAAEPVKQQAVPKLLPRHPAGEIRATLDQLLRYMALVEGLCPDTLGILVGLPHFAQPGNEIWRDLGEKPEPAVVHTPLPVHGTFVEDIQTVLLELSSGEVRLKQNGELFSRDLERVAAVLPPLPSPPKAVRDSAMGVEAEFFSGEDLDDHAARDPMIRAERAIGYSRDLGLLTKAKIARQQVLRLNTARSQQWLAGSMPHRLGMLFRLFHEPPSRDPFYSYLPSYERILGLNVLAFPRPASGPYPSMTTELKRSDIRFDELRESLWDCIRSMEMGTFYRVGPLALYLAHHHKPLLIGRKSVDDVVIVREDQIVHPIDSVQISLALELLTTLFKQRLIPRGAMQGGYDAKGNLLVARTPYTELYFYPDARIELPDTPVSAARVVVQPDFTVLVFGLDAAPAAELALFAERDRSSLTPGSFTFRITRESVARAVRQGQSAEQMIECLHTRSSVPVPVNVKKQIQSWADQIHRVERRTMTVYQCQTSEAADKLVGLLGKKAVRLGPNAVGTTTTKLTTAQITKLTAAGIFVDDQTNEVTDA